MYEYSEYLILSYNYSATVLYSIHAYLGYLITSSSELIKQAIIVPHYKIKK